MLPPELFHSNVAILDGALATELERRGFSFLGDPLWSARILVTDPKALIDVHESYLAAKANIITTCSYQASIPGFEKHLNLSVSDSRELIKLSVEMAKKAQEKYGKSNASKSIIAGSVGPYCAKFADGSEYNGEHYNNISKEELIKWHHPRVECLIEAGVDILAFETIPILKEAEALVQLLGEFSDARAWLSFSCQSMHSTSHGEDIGFAAQKCLEIAPSNQLVAIGVNCCPPECTESLLKDIASKCPDFPLVAYPNSGEKWCSEKGWYGERTMSSEILVQSWLDAGASIIGGCCRTTPDDIEKIFQITSKAQVK